MEAVGEYATPVRRIYDHLMAAFGLTALAGASYTIINIALATVAEALSVSMTDSDAWRPPVVGILAMLIIGIPVWGYYWGRLRLAYAADPESEATALSHRVYIFAVLGAGALAFLGGGGGTLFVILRDLLDAALSVETLRDLTPAIGFALTSVLFLPYHWAIYRADQAYQPDEPELSSVRKRVTLLVADGDSALARTVEDALGYPIREARWSDPYAFTPPLDEDELARAVAEVSGADGANVMLIPDQATGLKVISYD